MGAYIIIGIIYWEIPEVEKKGMYLKI